MISNCEPQHLASGVLAVDVTAVGEPVLELLYAADLSVSITSVGRSCIFSARQIAAWSDG